MKVNGIKVNPLTEKGDMPQEIFTSQQNDTETSEEFLIEVVSGFFLTCYTNDQICT